MEDSLREQMLATFFRLRKAGLAPPPEMDLPPGEGHAILCIGRFQEKRRPEEDLIGHLCTRMCVSKPAISQILSALERKGLITRGIDPEDRRRIAVQLTEQGHALVRGARDQMDERMRSVLAEFGEEDARTFIALSRRFVALIEGQHSQSE